ncbi:DNA primase family protein [Bacillus cereus]
MAETNQDFIKPYLRSEPYEGYPEVKEIGSELWSNIQEIKSLKIESKSMHLLSTAYPIQKLWRACCANKVMDLHSFVGVLIGNTPLTIKEALLLINFLQEQKIGLVPTLSLIEEIKKYTQYSLAHLRGLDVNEKNQIILDKVKFVNYLMNRVYLISEKALDGDGKIHIYNHTKGIYEYNMSALKRIITDLMNTALYNSWVESREKTVIDLLKRVSKSIEYEQWNETHMVFANAALNFETLEFEQFSHEIKATCNSNVLYNSKSDCPLFKLFLNEITQGDSTIKDVIQEIMGYTLSNSNAAQKAFFYYGEGANGKSVLSDIQEALISPKNVTHVALANLNSRFAMQSMLNKKLNSSNENEITNGLDTQIFKAIVGGDSVTVDIKGKAPVDVVLKCKLIFLINNLPNTKDYSHGFFRRIVIIPFNRQFHEEEQDRYLTEKLKDELPGILNFAVEGLRRLKNNDFIFTKSPAIEEMNEDYKKQQDPVQQFFVEAMEYCEGARTPKKDILDTYKHWLTVQSIASNGTESPRFFWKQLEAAMKKHSYKLELKKIRGYDNVANFKIIFKPKTGLNLAI